MYVMLLVRVRAAPGANHGGGWNYAFLDLIKQTKGAVGCRARKNNNS